MCTIVFFLLVIFASGLQAGESHFSTAGFYELAGSGREVYNMNVGWRFHKGVVRMHGKEILMTLYGIL